MTTSSNPGIVHAGSLLRPYWKLVLCGILLGLVGGASVASLLAVVNRGLYAGSDDVGSLIASFVGLCVLIVVGSVGSDISANVVGQRIIASLRKSLAAKILMAPIDQLESYRTHRLIPVLTKDVDAISDFAFFFPAFLVSGVIVAGCLVYLAVLSWPLFLVVAALIALGSFAHFLARRRGMSGFNLARQYEDDLQKHYRTIAEGAKELRLHRPRRHHVHVDLIQRTVERISDVQISAINLLVTARALGTVLLFLVIGTALVLRPLLWPDSPPSVSSGFVLVLLFMRGPIDQLIGMLPSLGRAQVAMRRIAELSERFATAEQDLLADPVQATGEQIDSIELRGVSYAFAPAAGDKPFVLGPMDLRIGRGEIVFIVGENGSGKTTLIKLLLGLYVPDGGELLRDGVPVVSETRDDYRQLFTTVFSDYYLFDTLLQQSGATPDFAQRYLDRLELAHKVSVDNGAFSTTDLSTGQRKRLALINAWIEERPVLVFDEWAADQDPAFRHIFYTELLADLKRLGKTIIVISHDDRYFHCADRIVRLRNGRIEEDEPARRGEVPRAKRSPKSRVKDDVASREPTRA
ncbi:putative Pyoverdine ABC export system, permease/ATP-binding protein [Bradyrhizobium sp. ORS 285]|uniref:cyclic peptide export ABC transporter n=1 Tax=Bradyrhizobium sp. ORS 285 TaxID=115808 RepID=UPI0002407E36|nr:cyclic peptide export ABC transporter [Bradyrhizobium sp. ORS 285]CCD85600.1 putative Pyoverdine ABC export system, permease/ATP-binding protein [Bradyrhizobium sp. ORS 285]SMX59875.1 putative Pyoverdine ABC export system, permease/ATP-binding protein [Bradyrhizobium sp. ORS 285]